MSKIRLWRLGSLKYGIAPTKKAAEKLKEILEKNDNIEDLDIIWGPDISVETIEGADEDIVVDCNEGAVALLKLQGYTVLGPDGQDI